MPKPASSFLWPFLVACLGIALFSVMDGVMKGLSIALGAYNAMLWRQLAGFGLGGTIFLLTRSRWPSPEAMRLHIKRGLIGGLMALTFFWGIARVPLAEGMALSFIAPLITLYLAALLLKERISSYSIIASLLGLAGVIVIMAARLGGDPADAHKEAVWGMVSILVSAVLYAYNLILQRQQAQIATPIEVAFFINAVALGAMVTAVPWLAEWPDVSHLPAIALAALLAFVSLMLMSWAYARAEAQRLVPIEYTAFLWAALVGWFAFNEPVTPATLAGAALIIVGCLIATRQPPAPIEATTK
jgi:S-adenosylmethionine uptake transporter